MKAINGRSGHTEKNLGGTAAFLSFVPTPLQDVELCYDLAVIRGLAEAEHALGRLSGAFLALGNERGEVAATTLRRKEAEASWRLATGRLGSQLALAGLLSPYSAVDEGEIRDLEAALAYGARPFDDLPICRRLLANVHYLAMQGPRYEKKYPGEVRWSPGWIGEAEATPATAAYVPPVGEELEAGLADLEHYIHDGFVQPALVRSVLAHYQFEALHPFIDGNGRVGRLLLQLMLVKDGELPADILQLSSALAARVTEYYARLWAVETEGDYEGWVSFMLGAVADAARDTLGLLGDLEGEVAR